MSRPPVLDIEALLAPISAEAPAGTDPRGDPSPTSLYYRVKDARAAGRAEERNNIDVDAATPEAWHDVLDIGTELISSEGKDIEVATWVTEALVRLEGFAGLRDGFTLIAELVSRFWDTLFPLPDEEDGNEPRLSPIVGLSGAGATGTLSQPIRRLPLVGVTRTFSIWNYDQTIEVDKIPDKARKEARIAAGTASLQTFKEALAETPATDLLQTLNEVDESIGALAKLGAALDAAAGYDSPSTSALRELLDHVAGAIRFFGAEKLAPLQKAAADAASAASTAAAAVVATEGAATAAVAAVSNGVAGGPRLPGMYATRDEALAELMTLAAYFRRTEPHSPISYTLEEAVRRARMSLVELLRELTHDEPNIYRFLLAAGIRYDGDQAMTSLPLTPPAPSKPAAAAPAAAAALPAAPAAEPPAKVVYDGWDTPQKPPSSDGW